MSEVHIVLKLYETINKLTKKLDELSKLGHDQIEVIKELKIENAELKEMIKYLDKR